MAGALGIRERVAIPPGERGSRVVSALCKLEDGARWIRRAADVVVGQHEFLECVAEERRVGTNTLLRETSGLWHRVRVKHRLALARPRIAGPEPDRDDLFVERVSVDHSLAHRASAP